MFNSTLSLYGIVKIYLGSESKDNLIYEDCNTIVNGGKEKISDFLFGSATNGLAGMVIGNGNTVNDDPDGTEVSLANQIQYKEFDSKEQETLFSGVTMRAAFNSSEHSGLTPPEINEIGLMFLDGTLLSIKNLAPRPFVEIEDTRYIIVWTVGIS